MVRPLVFISHIKAEREVAMALKGLVTDAFMGMIDVFVSSDPDSLAMGERWLDQITDGLRRCSIEIVVASPTSLKRPWINFEAGAGWVRDVPVIPICHSGMTPDSLPPPLNNLQAATATDPEQLANVFLVLARVVGCNCPQVNFAVFVDKVKAFQTTSHELEAADKSSLIADVDGLSDHALATLIAVAELTEGPGTWTWVSYVRDKMRQAGYRDIATSLGLAALARKGFAVLNEEETGNFAEKAAAVESTQGGLAWLESHIEFIELRIAPSSSPPNDDIPF
jgi:hypothetical protein